MQKPSQIVIFVVDKDLDIENHFIALMQYNKNKERGITQIKDENLENLLKLTSDEERKIQIEKIIEPYYIQKEKLLSITDDINREWIKIEKDYIHKLESVHGFPFPYTSIKGVLSPANKLGYDTGEGWFATNMRVNKYICIDMATHELMHFMFYKYYAQICKERGLSQNQIWDIKESFTVLLNIEFSQFIFLSDKSKGSPLHLILREIIKNSWEKYHDFNKALDEVIEYVKNN